VNNSLPKNQKQKIILHIDGDAFFVGVEVAKNPKLKGLPVVTGEERGIVSALSYEAKALGITRGMPIFKVKREFPTVIILPGDYKAYVKYSGMMFDIVRRYADDVEEYSIDECFADLTGLERTLKMTYRQIAERIKKEVNEELGLSVSIGIAPTKCLAKVASKFVKPNGLTVIEKETAKDFLSKTPIEKIWGIGPKTSEVLIRKGILTAQDFAGKSLGWITNNFSKPYEVIWKELNSILVLEIDTSTKTSFSSIQKTQTFHPDTNDKTFLLSQLSKHAEDACRKARYYKLVPKKISFFLKDKNLKYYTCLASIPNPSNTPENIIALINENFDKIYAKRLLYRTTGVILQDLTLNYVSQNDLFGNTVKTDKFELIHKQIDSLEQKFGKDVVYLASTQNALKHEEKDESDNDKSPDELDRNLLFL
jgi:DNA polymerase-4/DNA polymerase V